MFWKDTRSSNGVLISWPLTAAKEFVELIATTHVWQGEADAKSRDWCQTAGMNMQELYS